MQDFPSNSRFGRETEQPRERIEPVTSAEAVRRKRGLGRQFKETFFLGSSKDALSYGLEDVVVPAIRDTLHDFLRSSLDRWIFGEGHRPRMTRSSPLTANSRTDYTPYNKISSPPQTQRPMSRRARARHELDELVIPSREEANEVLDRMFEILSKYGMVSVAELYELTGIEPAHTDVKWGWTSLRGAKAMRLRQGGFLLDLPTPEAFT
jgi:hypothetical protein